MEIQKIENEMEFENAINQIRKLLEQKYIRQKIFETKIKKLSRFVIGFKIAWLVPEPDRVKRQKLTRQLKKCECITKVNKWDKWYYFKNKLKLKKPEL